MTQDPPVPNIPVPNLPLPNLPLRSRFQTFEDASERAEGPARLAALRDALKEAKLDGFVVPRADAHQSEYVPRSEERLAWLCGFTGSAGLCVVLPQIAAVFVDGRYTLQVRQQVDDTAFTPVSSVEVSVDDWLAEHAPKGGVIGFDPALHTPDMVERFSRALARAGARLAPVAANPIDAIWTDRPEPVPAPVVLHDASFAGESAAEKLKRVQAALAKEKLDALVVSDPHALCWLFNIRGGDVAHTPLVIGDAVVPAEGRPSTFIDGRKLDNAVRASLSELAEVEEPSRFDATLRDLGAAKARVRLDAATAGERLRLAIEEAGGTADVGRDPIALMKAVKNATEIEGSRQAHLRDGVAVTRFLAWLAKEAPRGALTEVEAALKLEDYRFETALLKQLSFPTIAGAGPHSAIPHYRVTTASSQPITPGIFLVDSGAQYQDGTTDITRTVAVGPPSDEMRDRFTRVLKGHIAIATSVFPKGISGARIDAFARRPLWEMGLDFDHGTGHGIGSYLSVHEGPQRISALGHAPLEAGMIVSNEPGYYKAGEYGIRIENLLLVERRQIEGAEREMLGFETLSLAPIDLTLIDPILLTSAEAAWLNAYHGRVRAAISPFLDRDTTRWLGEVTRPLM
ncbi:Xaa-Pro aminopeptidase [Rhizobiales bacterium GAS113]|nr:Xaa-Pro aminopeptidase [Rhizobiales bacterium GAS113]SEE56883.1 Xaa-Pro aminopeptidase [Rhizobiales bacterium GAS188]